MAVTPQCSEACGAQMRATARMLAPALAVNGNTAQSVMLQNGPLLFGATLFTLAGIQLLGLGLVSETLSHTYYESQQKPIYATRQIQSHAPEFALVWGEPLPVPSEPLLKAKALRRHI